MQRRSQRSSEDEIARENPVKISKASQHECNEETGCQRSWSMIRLVIDEEVSTCAVEAERCVGR